MSESICYVGRYEGEQQTKYVTFLTKKDSTIINKSEGLGAIIDEIEFLRDFHMFDGLTVVPGETALLSPPIYPLSKNQFESLKNKVKKNSLIFPEYGVYEIPISTRRQEVKLSAIIKHNPN